MLVKRYVGVAIVIMGMLVILTPRRIFPVCGVGRYAPLAGGPVVHHACHNTLKAGTALGVAAIIIGLIPLVRPLRKTVFWSSIAAIGISALVVLFPASITGVCKMPDMPCRIGTLPALVTVAALMFMVGVIGLLGCRKTP